MRSSLFAGWATIALVVGACAEPPDTAEEGTESTTADLLTSAGAVEPPAGSLPPGAPRSLTPLAEPAPQQIDVAILGVDLGSKDAPVRVVEFSDYGCGYCRKFHAETWPTLRDEFVATGKVEWKFLPFVSGMFRNSPVATVAAECVLEQGQEAFEAMNGRIWEGQADWKGAADAAPVVRTMARESGADMARYDACVASGARARRVDAATQLAGQLGVRGTPTFFVVGYPPLQGALPTDVFQQVLNMVYEEATKPGGDR